MQKLAAVALAGVLGICAMGQSKPAAAHVVVGVGIGLPGVTLVAPYPYAPAVGWYAPYYYGRPYAYGPGVVRFGYGYPGYGYRGYGYRGYGYRGYGYPGYGYRGYGYYHGYGAAHGGHWR